MKRPLRHRAVLATAVTSLALALTACNYHPSLGDDRRIAEAIERVIDAQLRIWKR